jgi:hypothetical protein
VHSPRADAERFVRSDLLGGLHSPPATDGCTVPRQWSDAEKTGRPMVWFTGFWWNLIEDQSYPPPLQSPATPVPRLTSPPPLQSPATTVPRHSVPRRTETGAQSPGGCTVPWRVHSPLAGAQSLDGCTVPWRVHSLKAGAQFENNSGETGLMPEPVPSLGACSGYESVCCTDWTPSRRTSWDCIPFVT